MSHEPILPPTLPQYIVDPLQRQSAERLDQIADYCNTLADHRRQAPTGSEAHDKAGTVVATDPDIDLQDVPKADRVGRDDVPGWDGLTTLLEK